MEVSTVNLQRGQFWIFNRVGFYGKGGSGARYGDPIRIPSPFFLEASKQAKC